MSPRGKPTPVGSEWNILKVGRNIYKGGSLPHMRAGGTLNAGRKAGKLDTPATGLTFFAFDSRKSYIQSTGSRQWWTLLHSIVWRWSVNLGA